MSTISYMLLFNNLTIKIVIKMLYKDYETVCDNCSLIVDECKCDVECSLCGFQHKL
jgi:hypothetical protein